MISTEPTTTTIFLALEPDEATCQEISGFKSRVGELVGEQLYLADPPHLTLYLAAFENPDDSIAAARDVAAVCTSPALNVVGWHVFEHDALTGLNTLVYEFDGESQDRLRQVQRKVIDRLAPMRAKSITRKRLEKRLENLSSVERQAAERWGFPYVGAGWHPHFTIASIKPADWSAVKAALWSQAPHGKATCTQLKVYELVDGSPVELAAFDLGEKRASRATKKIESPSPQTTDIDRLKSQLTARIWEVVERHDWILSATITGSFLTDDSLAAISDIDLVLVANGLNGKRFHGLQDDFTAALSPELASRGLKLRINPTLGPRKLNDDATAVLHMMLYSREGHHQHVIQSPFTCLDWQRSAEFRKTSLADVYPVFGLQPRHFMSARRGIRDYLHDFERGVVSYRELECSESSCAELKREEPMDTRDRYEYAYHVMRFLMQNLLKLVKRCNAAPDGELLLAEFFKVFERGAAEYGWLYTELRARKKARDFSNPIANMSEKLRRFVLDFEAQFRIAFIETATRHIVFRHAATSYNSGVGDQQRFLGRLDPSINAPAADDLAELIAVATDFDASAVYASPLTRCRESIDALAAHVSMPDVTVDSRLAEIDYGRCDGLTVGEARNRFSELFAAWSRGEDPRFPGGENTADVSLRINSFADEAWGSRKGNTIVCTHNVALRGLVGSLLSVPATEQHRIQIPHLAPITIVQTRQFGRFVDLEESVERRLFGSFLHSTSDNST